MENKFSPFLKTDGKLANKNSVILEIKGSIELTHESACNGVWKLQSMNVLKLLSSNLKAD